MIRTWSSLHLFSKSSNGFRTSFLILIFSSFIADSDCLSGSLKYGMNVIESNRKLEELKQQQETKKRVQAPSIAQETNIQEQLQVIDFRVWVTQEQKMKCLYLF